jgi:transketolase
MLNHRLHLNQKLFDSSVTQQPSRDGFGDALIELGRKNPHVVVLCADLIESTRVEPFARHFPDRFFEVGVAEQNMAAVAAGLGVSGKIPFIASYATFSPGRNWEQIRTTISYNNANVKIAGHHAGISVGPDGATHQALEDIATMRVMANMTVIVPVDVHQARLATLSAAHLWGPVYLRFTREKTPLLTTIKTPFVPGHAQVLWETPAPKVLFVGCGPILYHALLAARELYKQKIGSVVLNMHTVKPLDQKTLIAYAKKIGCVVTIEEHQVAGGLGSAVAECLSRFAPTPQEFIGMQDVFGESGTPTALLKKYRMDVPDIIAAAKKAMKRA